jgi:hypothetical protein
MPRFYFNYRGPDDQLVEDYLGSEQADIAAVEQEAQLLAQDILVEELEAGGPPSATRCVEVEDEHGEIVLYLPFWASLAVAQCDCPTVH